MLISPSSSTLHSPHCTLALSLSLHSARSIPLPIPSPKSANQSTLQTDRQTGRQTEAETETWQTAKKKEFIISVLIAFFILSKIFSASRSHKPSLSNFLNPPLSPTGSAFCMFRPHLSQTNNCLQEIQLCLLITDAPSGQISSTRTKRMLQAASKCFRYHFENYNRKWFP